MTNEIKTAVLAVVAVFLAGGAFAFASGSVVLNPDSSLAAVIASVSGTPSVTISKNPDTPQGTIQNNSLQPLALFDVKAKNISTFATLWNISAVIELSGPATQYSLAVDDLIASYRYCIPEGVTYGYGYAGGKCGTIPLRVSSVRNGNSYSLMVNGSIPVYPPQSVGIITISGRPYYFAPSNTAKLQIVLTDVYATGDQCKVIRYGYKNKYGYTKCTAAKNLSIAGKSAKGGILSIQVPNGYGYVKPKPKPADIEYRLNEPFTLSLNGIARLSGGDLGILLSGIDTVATTGVGSKASPTAVNLALSRSGEPSQKITLAAGASADYSKFRITLVSVKSSSATLNVVSLPVVSPTSARDAERIATIAKIQSALSAYFQANVTYPASLSALVPKFIASVPADPSGKAYRYAALGPGASCYNYHLGAALESPQDTALTTDADAKAGTVCTASAPDFSGADPVYGVTAKPDDKEVLRSRDARRLSDIKQLQLALALYFDSHSAAYPSTLASLAPTYITVIPTDPSGSTYRYAALGSGTSCSSYHLGATFEVLDNSSLSNDADRAASTQRCTGSAPDFSGADPVFDVRP